jgi:hypothetical protein
MLGEAETRAIKKPPKQLMNGVESDIIIIKERINQPSEQNLKIR